MPRVHGIDVVPRRGRPRPSFGSNSGGGSSSGSAAGGVGVYYASVASNSLLNDDAGDDDGDCEQIIVDGAARDVIISPCKQQSDLHASMSSLPIEAGINREFCDLSLAGGGKKGSTDFNCSNVSYNSKSSPEEDESHTMQSTAIKSNASSPKKVESRTIQSTAIKSNVTAIGTATMSIRPQAREILNTIEFGSSFSVQEITSRKAPPEEFVSDHLRLGSLGMRQSSELIVLPPKTPTKCAAGSTTATSLMTTTEDEEAVEVVKSKDDMKNVETCDERTMPPPPSRMIENETHASHSDEQVVQQSNLPTREQPIKVDDSILHDSNACWLYQRCSTSIEQMESHITPLEFSITILRIIRSIDNDDKFEGNLQSKLFDSTNVGKRRDLQLIYDVTERALELIEDDTLDVHSLQEVAANLGNTSFDSTFDEEEMNAHHSLFTQPIEENIVSATQVQIVEAKSSPRKIHRRKKPAVVNRGEVGSSNELTNDATNISSHADFPQTEDALDIQDDDKWTFLPSDGLEPNRDGNEDTDESTRRLTRSMGDVEEDPILGACNVNDPPSDNKETFKNGSQRHDRQSPSLSPTSIKSPPKSSLSVDSSSRNSPMAVVNLNGREGTNNTSEDVSEEKSQASEGTDKESTMEGAEVSTLVKMRRRSEGNDNIRVMFTGFMAMRHHMKMIETIGAEYVESIDEAHTATHVIASDGAATLRRTPKLMICICKVDKILGLDWLEQCAKEQRILDTHDFLLLDDKEAEKRYDFSMKETLRNGLLMRERRGGLFGGWFVYVCSGVAGNKAPSLKELNLIIEAGGGQVLSSLSDLKTCDPLKTIVLTSEPSTKSQLQERGVARAVSLGARIMSTAWLFHAIIRQKLIGIDSEDASDSLSALVASPISGLSVQSGYKPTTAIRDSYQSATTNHDDQLPIRIQGYSVSDLQRAPPTPLRRKKSETSVLSSQQLSDPPAINQQFYSHKTMLASLETISTSDDIAASITNELWLDFLHRTSVDATATSTMRPKKRGVRCLRGRKRSLSPLVTSTNVDMDASTVLSNGNRIKLLKSSNIRNKAFEDNMSVTWEAYVLFILRLRSGTIGCHKSLTSATIKSSSSFFPRPISITRDDIMPQVINQECSHLSSNKLGLTVNARQSGEDGSLEIFGSLQDVFTIHQQHHTIGMIPEEVVAMLSLHAVEAVAAMHSCGIVHNDIGLHSFLVVRRIQQSSEHEIDSWYLQMTGFGNKAVVLDCKEQQEDTVFEYDYHCLANIIHMFLTGGVDITLSTSRTGSLEFTSKALIKGNLFLRGAFSWCTLIDALMGVGEATSSNESSFRLMHPVDIVGLMASEDSGDCRMNQFALACRLLQELADGRSVANFIDGLALYNSRFIFPTDLSSFVYKIHDGPSFSCYTANAQTVYHLSEKERKLQADTFALAQREAELAEKIAQFELTKTEHKTILQQENEYRIRVNELVTREEAHAREVELLKAMKEDLYLRERRLEQKYHSDRQLLAGKTSSESNLKIHAQEESFISPKNSAGFKRKAVGDQHSHSESQDADDDSIENLHRESQESHGSGSVSSAKRRKRGTRKSPICSLLNLPKSPAKSTRKQQTPKKVFIDLGED